MKNETVNFRIEGGRLLKGSVTMNTAKNSAVGLLCASLLNKGTTTLKNMPKIEEVFRLIEVLKSIHVLVKWQGSDLVIKRPEVFSLQTLDRTAAIRTRSILMFIGPLIHFFKDFYLPQAGGCKLGSRTVRPHFFALEKFGVKVVVAKDRFKITASKKLKPADIVLYEAGDTVTENALMAAALVEGETNIRFASANYQVQDVAFFLEKLGVRVDGIGTTKMTVHGASEIEKDVEYYVSEDPTEAMFFLSAAIVTKSSIELKRVPIDFLELELFKLEKMGFKYKILRRYKGRNGEVNLVDLKTMPSTLKALEEKIAPQPYPGLNIDHLPFFAVIATQAKGQTLIHDWVYEKRAIYYTELDKLGADTILADPHRVYINGPTELLAKEVICPPALRPATILLIAMLGAKGTSVLRDVYSINRGYEDLATRLNKLGAKIKIVNSS
ncbi:MAG: UDP-N-acetylglucosamine 1-carboxyvinyltransferase [Candidatus Harrisonbacteria bacterium CG10_big_fil_rev_8_21_14_0_10_45_28]|uniref:UDP-N-acetylglucosamine 1-carboxyvinyltransferase n=1 Tax=Candidatus Harrisonbacteria bacterium CG10_big_fil_rev_8_21_14_0_10_45_28 TaxID=1974586 RepID=A0A2H0UMQ1_9BACT|nr:MAG: UDP-N-acetylglucosamine 1-carboxyvinyltransferase [Candidatus Harrisonbacteria bacterium CG10_big_fil_rev_8_21_14_0_10_45_28]